MIAFLIYLTVCVVVGYVGRKRKLGFWGYFFGSLLLSPLVGAILVFASDPRPPKVPVHAVHTLEHER